MPEKKVEPMKIIVYGKEVSTRKEIVDEIFKRVNKNGCNHDSVIREAIERTVIVLLTDEINWLGRHDKKGKES